MLLIGTLIMFVISLLVGATGIYIGARVIIGTKNFTYTIITALISSIVWAGVAFLLGWIPFLGPLLALSRWVAARHRDRADHVDGLAGHPVRARGPRYRHARRHRGHRRVRTAGTPAADNPFSERSPTPYLISK